MGEAAGLSATGGDAATGREGEGEGDRRAEGGGAAARVGDAGRAGVGEGLLLKLTDLVITEVTGRGERGDRGEMEPSMEEGGGARLGGGGGTSSSTVGAGIASGGGFGVVSFGTGLGSARIGEPSGLADRPSAEAGAALGLSGITGDLAMSLVASGAAAFFTGTGTETGAGAAGFLGAASRNESSSSSSRRSILVMVTARGFRAF